MKTRKQYFSFNCRLTIVAVFLFVGCTSEPVAPIHQVKIEMIGNDFKWNSRYAGRDGEFNTEDDRLAKQVLHVPLEADIEIVLKSRDYLYTLELPFADKEEIAVPDLAFSLQFKADRLGSFKMPGSQMCGYTHPDLIGTLIIESQEEFSRWLDRNRNGDVAD
ncbi:MAG: hypothetical protein CMJ74_03810 [Planctomycetaceae bacterium]|nr:hypothetical protein [Planctomycetaceae bacterium]|tara:strand:- start:450 stop:935 length:486 start_codon:yes stop_codon:yes gene_type:complete